MNFWFSLKQGVNHILDIEGLDHFYFILAFSLLYRFKEWKKLIGLITAFTVGHSITLILSALDIVHLNPNVVEMLIPITILITCLSNYYHLFFEKNSSQRIKLLYPLLVFFGLIHGLGFSTFFKAMVFEGDDITPLLLGFNVGIEIAQIIIVICFLVILEIFALLPIKNNIYLWVFNSIITLLVIRMMI